VPIGALTLPAIAADGGLDPAFGTGGRQIVQIVADERDFARTIAVQPDNKIVVGGELGDFGASYNASVLMRLNPNGSLDQSFGTGGRVVNYGQLHLPQLVLQPDGKIVTAAATSVLGTTFDFAVARYNADGTLDQTFGSGGYAINGSGNANGVVLQSDGKIVLIGFLPIFRNGSDFLLARFNPDGTPDQTFGSGGRVQTSFTTGRESGDQAISGAMQADGKLVVSGFITGVPAAIVRYNPDGAVDLSFGLDGAVLSPTFGGVARRVVIQPDGRIIIGGGAFILGRFLPDGHTDTTFGVNGRTTGGFGSGDGALYGLAIGTDGRIFSAGSVSYTGTGDSVFAIGRYTPNGSLDPTFGTNGFALTDFTGALDEGFALALQPDGKPVVAGYAAEPGGSYHDFAMARYLSTRKFPTINHVADIDP
jgi:uncharacterized delta-60 repeat protein